MREFTKNINHYNENNNFLLEVSIMNGNIEGVKKALEAGVDQYYPSTDTSYIVMAAQQKEWEIVDLLMEDGFDINVDNQFGHSLFHWACESAPVEMVEKLINYGVRTNVVNKKGETPLYIAVKNNRLDNVDLLLNQLIPPSVFVKDTDHKTMLHHCAERGYQEMFNKIWFQGVDLYATDNKGKQAIDYIKDEEWKAELPQLEIEVNEILNEKGIDPKNKIYTIGNEEEEIKEEKETLLYTLKAHNGISHITKKKTLLA